jgi:hypothetical protein
MMNSSNMSPGHQLSSLDNFLSVVQQQVAVEEACTIGKPNMPSLEQTMPIVPS